MATDNKNLAVPQSGMVRDKHPSSLQDSEYSFALNANIESEDGNVGFRSNEHSTLKCIEFEGYKVIGYKNDLSTGDTYYFLTNPDTGYSKICYLRPTENTELFSDGMIEGAVNGEEEICAGLQVLIEDEGDEAKGGKCLNFSLYHPIKTIEIKDEKCGKRLYWTDGYNPPRYVDISKALEPDDDGDIWYHYHGWKICGERETDGSLLTRDEFIQQNGCVLACEKLRVFPLLEQPCVEPAQIEYGGSLRAGVYQFAVALCDEFGNEKTNYSQLTNPIHIFDQQYKRIVDGKWGERTNLGIRLVVSNLDRQVSHFKIVVVQNTVGYNGEQQPVVDYYIEGVHPVTEKTILYYSDLNNKRTTFEHISYKRAVYNTSRGIVSVDNRLLQYGLTAEKEWNLQPAMSLFGHFLKWQVGVSSESLYKDGNACSLYAGYMRNEVYPFSISFKTSTGYQTPAFILVPPPYKGAREAIVDDDGNVLDEQMKPTYDSINQYSPDCAGIERKYKWQYVNTIDAADGGEDIEDLTYEDLGEELSLTKDGECKNPATIGKTIIEENNFYRLSEHVKTGISVVIETENNIGNTKQYFADNLVSEVSLACNNPYVDKTLYPNDPQGRDYGAVALCGIISDYNKNLFDKNDSKMTEIDGIKTPSSDEFGDKCGNITRKLSTLSVPIQSIENFKEDYIYKKLEDMNHISTDYLYSAGGQSQNKYSLLFDYQAYDDLENWLEAQMFGDDAGIYSDDGDNQHLSSKYQPYFQAGTVLKAVSDAMYILDTVPCVCGCNENSVCVNPYINSNDFNSFQSNVMFISSRIAEYDFWNTDGRGNYIYNGVFSGDEYKDSCYGSFDDNRAGRSTSSVVNKAYNSLKAPQILLDVSWSKVPSAYENDSEKRFFAEPVRDILEADYLFDGMVVPNGSYPAPGDSGVSCTHDDALWIWETYTNLADEFTLFPSDWDSKPQLVANKHAYRFMDKIGKNARFIRIDRPSEWDEVDYPDRNKVLYLEALGKIEGTKDAYSPEVVRITFWRSLPDTTQGISGVILSQGPDFNFKESGILKKGIGNTFYIVKANRPGFAEIGPEFFEAIGSNSFYVTIDTPVVYAPWFLSTRQIQYAKWTDLVAKSEEEDSKKPSKAILGGSFALGKTTYPYIFGIREKEVNKINVYASDLILRSTVVFQGQCETCGDKPLNCAPRPYKQGNFAYWESSEKYPANYELYDSSRMKVNTGRVYEDEEKSKAYNEILTKLREYYGSEIKDESGYSHFEGTTYGTAETSTVFCQQPIRHYKFPDNRAQYFMSEDAKTYDTEAEIYPLGLLVDEEKMQIFLDFCVDSGFITQEQRDTVVGYEIFRGDRRLNRSVISTGVAYDMFKWFGEDGNIMLYPNYPYNDLSDDYYNFKTKDKYTTINHPFYKEGNVWYSYISPDNYLNKPELPTEVSIEGFQQGASVGEFNMVENHPKWTILGSKAYKMASTLANIESIATVSAMIAEELQIRAQSAFVGLSTNISIAMLFTNMVLTISQTLAKQPVLYGKYRYDWLNTFVNNGPRLNYAAYYSSVGYYNSIARFVDDEQYWKNHLRGLSSVKRINSGMYPTSDASVKSELVTKRESDDYKSNDGTSEDLLMINNILRESSMFFSFGDPEKFLVEYPAYVKNFDTSRVVDAPEYSLDSDGNVLWAHKKYISSINVPYMKAMRYLPSQYGQIEDIKWISTGGCGFFKGHKRMLYGGDIFISRFSLKRKFPMFFNNAFSIGDMIPFPYNDYRNVGSPRYYCNYDTGDDMLELTDNTRFNTWTSSFKGSYQFYPNRYSLFNFNAYQQVDKYVRGRFYLWFYGIPQFLVESELNCNFRLEGSQPHEWFYPEIGDYVWWTQEKNVSIERDNDYKISPIYSSRNTIMPNFLPATYEKKFYDCSYQRPNGVIWSVQDVSENSQTDPWLTYKPFDFHEFPTRNGSLMHMKRIESNQILARFEDQVSLHNAIDVIRERTSGAGGETGTGGLFQSRPLEYNTTDLGYSGTQSTEMVSSEFGHFWVDVKRGQVFMTDPNGRNLKELSTGIRHWLKEHLPFKILKYGIINVATGEEMTYEDVDNKFISLGLSLGWDNRFKRVFITKKDYIPTQNPAYYKYNEGKMYYGDTEVNLHNASYFKDVSFTVAYSCIKQEWISYYSFCPDYYVEQQSYFQSGLNFSGDNREVGLWSHLLTNKSFQTFYGTTYPFILEVPMKEKFQGSILSSVEYELDARRYVNNVNYTLDRKVGLDSMVLYNETNNSGELILIPEEKNNMMQKAMYPRVVGDHTEVLDTEVYRRHKVNDIFNYVKDDRSGDLMWIKDENDIMRSVNGEVMDYKKSWLDRLRGSYVMMRLKKTIRDRKIIFQWIFGEDKVKNR